MIYGADYGVSIYSADNATAFANLSNAINGFLSGTNSVRVVLPAGVLNHSAGLNITRSNVTIEGNGTYLYKTGGCVSITVYNPGGMLRAFNVVGVVFASSVDRSAASTALNIVNVRDIRVTSCTFLNQTVGTYLGTYGTTYLTDCIYSDCVNGVVLNFGDDIFMTGVYVSHNVLNGEPRSGTIGILVYDCGAVYITQSSTLLCDIGIRLAPGTRIDGNPQQCFAVFVGANTIVDTCTQGLYAAATDGNGVIRDVHINDAWFSSARQFGILINGANNVKINGNRIIMNLYDGVYLASVSKVQFNSNSVQKNNVANNAHGREGAGIRLETCSGFMATGNEFCNQNSQGLADVTNQRIGIYYDSSSTNMLVGCNSFVGHSIGGIYPPSPQPAQVALFTDNLNA